ncbi:MAG TPA: hypothetical protein DDZ88_21270 [Verrucomicrobiales bacterium]|nr:hypothetical protein [Verrucomicrobiales bacterium]
MFPRHAAALLTGPRLLAAALGLWCLSAVPSQAILFYDTGDANHNTTAPTGTFEDSGWQYEGKYGSYLGTIIAPQYFITAQHYGTQGGTFTHSGIFNGGSDVIYNIDLAANGGAGYWDIAGTDLRIFKVEEYFPYYAPLYTGTLEVGLTLVTHGMGGPRGDEVLVGGDLHGWEHTGSDATARWGTNTVSGIYSTALGDLLTASFSASGTLHEASLSGGDSGGGVFVNDGGVWKLAGVNYSIDGRFDTNNTTGDGSDFDAALFDRGGLYQGSDAFGWSYNPDLPLDNPSNLYASRISTNAAAIMSIAVVPEPHSALLVMLAALCGVCQRRRITPQP